MGFAVDTSFVAWAISFFTLLGDIFLALLLAHFIWISILKKKSPEFVAPVKKVILANSLAFAFLVALAATLGSLFMSEVAHYPVCSLCWVQRVFMYPQALLLGAALFANYRKLAALSIPMSVLGGMISVYQYSEQRFAETGQQLGSLSVCSATGPSCASTPFLYFGYITIPLMAVTAFALIICFVLISRGYDGKN
ncbi:disulfide formation protein [Candidatus Gugararchaeum adminiculabundum]|nr:disulfide formation protein [Candidatus Gugararchaeum adminiculabundum]